MDYTSVSLLIGAIAALISSVGGIVLQTMVLVRQGKNAAQAGIERQEQTVKLQEVHTLVNGQSERLQELSRRAGFSEGEKAERDHPTKER